MNAVLRLAAFVSAALASMPLGANAQEYRWVRGTVTAITNERLTIYVASLGLNLPFAVDRSSLVLGFPTPTYTHPPEQMQPSLTNLVRPGSVIEVHYYARTGPPDNYAGIIRGVGGGQESGRSVAGRVTALSRETLTVEVDDRPHTFAVDPATLVIGPGFGTATQKKRKAGETPGLADIVQNGDLVLVLHRVEGTASVATDIQMLRRSR